MTLALEHTSTPALGVPQGRPPVPSRHSCSTPPIRSREDLAIALARVASGDRQAFARVYAATHVKLMSVILRIVHRHAVAEELLQDVYLCVWQRAGSFDATCASAMTWLCTIARNRALDETKRVKPQSFEDCPEHADVPCDVDIGADVLRQEDCRWVRDCMERLPPEKRLIIQLAYFDNLSREEIAARVGRPVGTVKTLIRRALADLKQQAIL